MAGGSEAEFEADLFAEAADLVVAELDHPVALGAVEVVVRGVTEVVLVGGSVGQAKLAEQPGFDQEAQGAVNRGSADLATGEAEVGDEFVGVEVLVVVEDVADQNSAGLGELFASDFEKLTEFVFRVPLFDMRAEGNGFHQEVAFSMVRDCPNLASLWREFGATNQ